MTKHLLLLALCGFASSASAAIIQFDLIGTGGSGLLILSRVQVEVFNPRPSADAFDFRLITS